MQRPRFSEILYSRRVELGLSVSQASKILKLREDVLVAFEEGDYEHMPQSGYAQGMLSSYARYLGLNARELVDLFQEEFYEWRHGTSSHELRRRTRDTQAGRGIGGYDLVNEAGSRPKAYVEYRPLLPTSGGPAGDMGDFATTAPVRRRNSVPLAGTGTPAPGTRSAYASTASYSSAPYATSHQYNSSAAQQRSAPSTARRRPAGQRRRTDEPAGRASSGWYDDRTRQMGSSQLYRRDDVSTRRVRPSEYTDDMRYDDRANPYAPASTISGRRSSRNIASVERPNVRRRAPRGAGRSTGRSGRRPPQRGGVMGVVEGFFSDPRRALFAIIVLLVLVLTCILVFSVTSCVNGKTQSAQTGQSVTVGTASQDDSSTQSSADDGTSSSSSTDAADGTGSATDSADSADAAATDEQTVEETVVEVSVASGELSWIEITCDGTSEIADSVTGPWSASYTVYDSITIQVANPSAVTVTNNGEKVDFSSKASGVGTITIKGTPKAEDAEGDANADSSTTDGSSSTGTTA